MSLNQRFQGFGGFSLFPPVIKFLIISNAAIYFLQYFVLGVFHFGDYSFADVLFTYGALFPIDSSHFYAWQLITYQFLHGGFGHVFFNLLMLWMFGAELENEWGSRKFIIFYLISGIGAGLVQLFISPMLSSTGPTIGASGAIYGIMLAFALTYPERQIMIFPIFIPIRAKFLIIILVGMDLLLGLTTVSSIARFAHLGGAATGYLLLKFGDRIGIYNFFDNLFSKKKTTVGAHPTPGGARIFQTNWRRNPYTERWPSNNTTSTFNVDGEEITQSKIDEILDKISVSGYQNLTEKEKMILFQLSQKLK